MTYARHLDLWPESLFFSYEFQRVIAMAASGGADIGECLRAAAQIDPDDLESWGEAWTALAEECEAIAGQPGRTTVSKRDALLRASNYWRAADFLLSPSDPRKLPRFRQSQRAFQEAAQHLPYTVQPVQVPYEGTVLESYFVHPEPKIETPRPVVIFGGTMDTTAEEHFFAVGRALVERGFAVLLFDGPGQGATLRLHQVPARYDYEVPVAAAIDWLSGQPGVDTERIVIMGWGGGGYYACRAAAFEPRLAGCIAWNTLYQIREEGWLEISDNASSLEELAERAGAGEDQGGVWGDPRAQRFLVETWVWRLFPADVPDFVAKLAAHDLTGVLPKLTCPLLILQGEEDGPETARRVHDEAGSQDKTLILYPPVAPGSRHVQVDGMLRAQADMGDWLANRFLV